MTTNRNQSDLVDLTRGTISREIFVNSDIYKQELEQIFAKAWLFVGHESQVPKQGDFFVSCMAEESVILCRDRQNQIHVFLNTCRHRGMKVCRYDEGNTPVFSCPYHGWSYATDGKLVGVPYFKAAYHEQLDKSQWGLIEVAQMVNYKGSIWATWDQQAPSFLDFLGDFRIYLDTMLDGRDGREGQATVLLGIHKWIFPSNWKLPAENFSGDAYHNISHRSVDMVGIGPSGAGRRDNDQSEKVPKVHVSIPEGGHAGTFFHAVEDVPFIPAFGQSPTVQDYFRGAYEERQRRLGKDARLLGLVGTVFPNMSFLARQPRSIAVWHPRGPLKTEAWRWYFVDADTPDEVKDFLRHYYMRYSGPAGMTEQDDMENWNYATMASQGTIAKRYPFNYEMGLGHSWTNGPIPGVLSGDLGEENQRGFFKRWVEYMAGDPWGGEG